MQESDGPLFLQVAELVENAVVDGSLAEDDRAPSTNELAAFHAINPATARKGLTLLAERGILTKRRGVGMFVTPGAREAILSRRRASFADDFLRPLLREADRLGLSRADLHAMLDRLPAPGTETPITTPRRPQ